jgi:RNA polymerase sigma-B factor
VSDPAPSPRFDAREQLIAQHLPLVHGIARRFASSGEQLDDLVQAGSIGLIKAVDRFDPDRGPSLAAFAAPVIEGEIRHHLRRRRRHATRETAEPPDGLDGGTPGEGQSEARLALAPGWQALPDRERRLLELRFFEDRTQAQIASELGISQAHVSRLLRAALDRLRAGLDDGVAPAGGASYSRPDMASPAGEPEEQQRAAHSGRLLVRMPQSLHTELARAAEREGVSLNTLVTGALAGAVGWRDGARHDDEPDEAPPATPAEAPDAHRRSWLLIALAANITVVAVAAVVAIALLLTAWQGS